MCTLAQTYYATLTDPSCEVFSEALDWLYQLCSQDEGAVKMLQDCEDYMGEARRKCSPEVGVQQEESCHQVAPKVVALQEESGHQVAPRNSDSENTNAHNEQHAETQHAVDLQTQVKCLPESTDSSSLTSDSIIQTDNNSNIKCAAEETKENQIPTLLPRDNASLCGSHDDGRTMFASLDNHAVARLSEQFCDVKLASDTTSPDCDLKETTDS